MACQYLLGNSDSPETITVNFKYCSAVKYSISWKTVCASFKLKGSPRAVESNG